MMYRCSLLTLLSLLLLSSGCTGSRKLLEAPQSQRDINTILHRYTARIILRDGQIIRRAKQARLGVDELQYRRPHLENVVKRVPVAEVLRIEVDINRGRDAGAVIGVAPGIAIMASGVLFTVAAPEDSWAPVIGLLNIAGGLVVTVAGGIAGDLVGGVLGKTETYVIYEATIKDEAGNVDE